MGNGGSKQIVQKELDKDDKDDWYDASTDSERKSNETDKSTDNMVVKPMEEKDMLVAKSLEEEALLENDKEEPPFIDMNDYSEEAGDNCYWLFFGDENYWLSESEAINCCYGTVSLLALGLALLGWSSGDDISLWAGSNE